MDLMKVSKKEFEEYIASYPRKLVRDVCGICDPPEVSYNDITLGTWPESRVATHFLFGRKTDNEGLHWRILK